MNVCSVQHCYNTTNTPLCDTCLTQLTTALAWVHNYNNELEYRLNPANQPHTNNTTKATGSSTLPLHAQLATILITGDERNDSLIDLLKHLASSLGIPWNPSDSLGELTQLLLDSRYTNRLNSTVTAVYKPQICSAVYKCKQTLNPPQDRIIVGICPNPQCATQLKAQPDDTTVTCSYCKSVWSTKYIRQQQYERIIHSNHADTTARLQTMLTYLGYNIKPSTIRSWIHRGKLTPVDATNHTYRLKDIVQLARKEVK